MNQNQPDRHGNADKPDKERSATVRKHERHPGRGSQHGSGDQAELQDQEEFDRGKPNSPASGAD